MQRFIVIRIFHAVIALLAISLIIFALIRISGDPLDTLLDEDATEEDDARVRAYWGLDQPLHIQYVKYMGNIATGKLGQSIRFPGKDASELLMNRLPATLELALVALIVSALIALPLGVIVAVKKDTGIDIVGKIIALLGQSIPSFWLGLMLMWVFAVHFQLLPTSGRGDLEVSGLFGDRIKHLILPGIALGYFQVAALMRLIRSSMLEVLDTEYVKLARIKGIPEWKVIWKHVFRNAAIAPLTFFGLILGNLLLGSVSIETVFQWPGLGFLAYEAVFARDFPLVQGIVLVFSAIFILVNFIVDVLYAYLDPRIRYQ